MSEKNNKMKLYGVLVVILIIGGLFGIFSSMKNAIADHPEIVTLKVQQAQIKRNQERIENELQEVNRQLREIDKKISRLLAENYP
jgi:peptidoglycan hydrolase CwlO-like protein